VDGGHGSSADAVAGTASEAVARPGRARWTKGRVALVVLAALILLPSVRNIGWDIFDEGREATFTVIAVAESVLEVFAPDRADSVMLYIQEPVPCADAPPWAPNRVSFYGQVASVLPEDTDFIALLDHIEEQAAEFGLTVRRRDAPRYLYLLNRRGTDVSITLFPAMDDREAEIWIGYSPRCLPPPRGYRGGSYESRRALIDDWSGRIGFQSGPLAEARIR
jgi:hypothetical protein